jgi:phage shock protein A
MEQTGQRPEDLRGMDRAAARDYIRGYLTTLKLTEKKREALEGELSKWRGRAALAQSRGEAALAAAAEREAARLEGEFSALAGEEAALRSQIEAMVRQLPGIAARERRIDQDLLEQELLILLGRSPGADLGAAQKIEADFERLDAEDALQALKAKMRKNGEA